MTGGHRQLVSIATDAVRLEGVLALPAQPVGLVLFAHGSGSSRQSPRNSAVAAALREVQVATLLMDLLSEDENHDTAMRFDIAMLVRRLGAAADWIADHHLTRDLPLGLFGGSTGAAAALTLAARRPGVVRALVVRGGRPDLAGTEVLPAVRAPTLLIAGGLDTEVVALNRAALQQLQCECRLDVIPGASHLFEEPGRLPIVIALALDWFERHLHA